MIFIESLMVTIRIVLIGFSIFFCLTAGLAHGDFHVRLKEVTEEIRMNQDSAFLFFKRGKLYFHHEEYPAALEDLQHATVLGLEDTFCDLLYAKTYQQLDSLGQALIYIEKIERKNITNVVALNTKAQIYFEQKKYQLSALTLEEVISKSRRTIPENYLDAARSWELSNAEASKVNALNILQQGISKLGPLFVFYIEIRELHLRSKNFEKALSAQKKIIDLSNRKETALYKAAEICLLLDKTEAARKYLLLGLEAVTILPSRLKNNKVVIALQQKMENTLLKL